MKYVFKSVTPQQDLAGNVYALENGNDLLFKEVPECGISKNKKKKKPCEIQNVSHPSSCEFWMTASVIESAVSENTTPCSPELRIC